ncbi:MAG: hypothetical protein QG671_4262 [Actinomycetota bacterium]|nr:hypothetical protein [Actinomycetota bacterium]
MTKRHSPHDLVPDLHVGHGIDSGALTLFPVWTAGADKEQRGYLLAAYRASELPGAPSVSRLTLTSTGQEPVLVLEGTILEGGMQHRVVLHSVLLAPGQSVDVDVACVEAGRWDGDGSHSVGRWRAPSAVRGACYGLRPEAVGRERAAELRPSDQSDVWRRVHYYERAYGPSDTSSLVEVSKRFERSRSGAPQEPSPDTSPVPLPGQRGVIIGVAGHPLLLELFDDSRALADQWESILQAARLDAGTVPPERVASWRARSFAARISGAPLRQMAIRGLAAEVVAEDLRLFSARGLSHCGDLLHLSVVNTRHELILAA